MKCSEDVKARMIVASTQEEGVAERENQHRAADGV